MTWWVGNSRFWRYWSRLATENRKDSGSMMVVLLLGWWLQRSNPWLDCMLRLTHPSGVVPPRGDGRPGAHRATYWHEPNILGYNLRVHEAFYQEVVPVSVKNGSDARPAWPPQSRGRQIIRSQYLGTAGGRPGLDTLRWGQGRASCIDASGQNYIKLVLFVMFKTCFVTTRDCKRTTTILTCNFETRQVEVICATKQKILWVYNQKIKWLIWVWSGVEV